MKHFVLNNEIPSRFQGKVIAVANITGLDSHCGFLKPPVSV